MAVARPRYAAESAWSAALGAGVAVAVVAVTFGGVAGLLGLATRNDYGGPAAWLGAAVVLTAGALGVPTHFAMTSSVTSTGIGFLNADTSSTPKFTVTTAVTGEIRATVWLITLAFAVLLAMAARRSESARPSASVARLVTRVLATAAGSTAALYVLALTARGPNALVFKAATIYALTAPPGPGGLVHGTVSVDTAQIFVGPLLVALAAAAVGRIVAVVRRYLAEPGSAVGSTTSSTAGSTTNSTNGSGSASTLARLASTWRGPASVVWLQLRAIAALSAAVLLFNAVDAAVRSASVLSDTHREVLGLIPLLGNFGVGGGLLGFGATLFRRLGPGSGAGAPPGFLRGSGSEFGLVSGQRPAVLFALLAAALLGTALPALKLRLRPGPRPGDRDAHGRMGLWRAAVLGAAAGLAAALPGQLTVLSLTTTLGTFGGVGSPGVPSRYGEQLGFGVAGSVAAGAAWCVVAYLGVLAVAARGSVAVPSEEMAGASPGVATTADATFHSPSSRTVSDTAPVLAPDGGGSGDDGDDAQLVLLDADPLAAEPLEMLPDRGET